MTYPLDGSWDDNYLIDQNPLVVQRNPQASWVPEHTILLYDVFYDEELLNPDNALLAVGRGRLQAMRRKFLFERVHNGGQSYARLKAIRVAGTLSDLYDFNQEPAGFGCRAATMQLGFGRGTSARTKGQIFRHTIRFEEELPAWYYDEQDRFFDKPIP